MDLFKLKSFKTVAELESFSKAAEILYLTQPAVSAQIKDLESDYNAKLFDRVGRKIKITRSGEVLLRYVNKILETYEDSRSALNMLKDDKSGIVRLNVSELPGTSLLPSVLAGFKKDYPNVSFVLKSEKSKNIIDSIKKNNFDLGIIVNSTPVLEKTDLIDKVLFKDKIVLGVSKDHAFSNRKSINVQDLSNEPIIVSLKDRVSRQALDDLFHKHSIPFHFAYELESKSMTKSLVQKNLGIAFFSSLEIQNEVAANLIHAVSIEEVSFYRYVHVIHHRNKDLTPSVLAFYNYMFSSEIHDVIQKVAEF